MILAYGEPLRHSVRGAVDPGPYHRLMADEPVHRLVIEFRGDPAPIEALLPRLPYVAAQLDLELVNGFIEHSHPEPATRTPT